MNAFTHRFSFLAFFCIALLIGCGKESSPTAQVHRINGSIFGTTYSVQIATETDLDLVDVQRQIDARLQTIDHIMSTWKKNSEISYFNDHIDGNWFTVSAELGQIVRSSKEIYKTTLGAFDPTLGPLIKLWGFNGNRKLNTTPDPIAIDVAQSQIGMYAIEIAADNKGLKKSKSLSINLSAIAKGYAVDQVATILEQQQFDHFLVEIGGELRVQGSKNGRPWTVGIELPDPDKRQLHRAIEISNTAMATSGDYRNFFEKDGQRYSHILDPRTGYPIKHALASVTVLAPDCATADGYATAFMVLGPQKSKAIAEQKNLALYMLVANAQGGFDAIYTDSFAPYLTQSESL